MASDVVHHALRTRATTALGFSSLCNAIKVVATIHLVPRHCAIPVYEVNALRAYGFAHTHKLAQCYAQCLVTHRA